MAVDHQKHIRRGQFMVGGNMPVMLRRDATDALDDTDARANLDALLQERTALEQRLATLAASLAALRARK
jgi:hypothetical protein